MICKDLGIIDYQAAWDVQEALLQQNIKIKAELRNSPAANLSTTHHFLLCEHPPVYTLGKSGHEENMLINATDREKMAYNILKPTVAATLLFMACSK